MKIKSSIRTYEVSFIEYEKFINEHYSDGDIIIIDERFNLDILENKISIRIKSSEEHKEYNYVSKIISEIISNGFKKNNKLFAIGGGVIQDITGFISSILYRGVEWYFIPTTLLSQGDSCIGGKTSINFGSYKNQIGNFYPPTKIGIDTIFLDTLPKKEIYSGLGEMLHYFIFSSEEDLMIYDKLLEDHNYYKLIKSSLEIKKSVIEIDELENGVRKLFNYGHTFGHAIESITDYNIPHGIAVAHGMKISNFISMSKGFLDYENYIKINSVINKITKNYELPNFDINHYFELLKKDKKNSIGIIKPILIQECGELFQHEFTYDSDLLPLLIKYFEL